MIPSWIVAVLWLLLALACTYNIKKTTGVLRFGLFILAIVAYYFSGMYFYFTTYVLEIDLRQRWVRGGLSWVAVALLYWQYRIFRGA